jgi:hypothetical protein
MNSVFSAFKSNKGSNNSPSSLSSSTANSSTSSSGNNKKTLYLNETNNYEKLRHIREKMSNLMIDDDEINLRKPPCSIPITPIDLSLDECDSMLPPVKPKSSSKMNGFDCIDSAAAAATVNGNHKNYTSASLSTIRKHYNQDNSENYASENNLLSKCCNGNSNNTSGVESSNGGGATAMGSDVSIADASDDVNSASSSSLISIKSMPLSNSNEASRSALSIYNKQPQSSRNRPRLSLSSANCNGSSTTTVAATSQPAVHGRNSSNGLPTGGNGQTRTRLSTHQRNLSLDFR